MKFFSKLTAILAIATAPLVSVSLTSCDGAGGGSQGDLAQILDEIAESLAQVVADDTITLTTTSGEEILTGDITATNAFQFDAGDNIVFDYLKIGTNDFRLTGSVDAVSNFTNALSQTLGDPGALSDEIRDILLLANGSYTRAELQRIIDILAPAGPVDLILHPTEDVILAVVDLEYFFRIESTNADLLDGTISGIFNSRINYYRVKFRDPTSLELQTFRLLTPSHDIPFLDINDNVVLEDTQGGLFNMELVNVPGTILP